ncbi:MAG: hypothetical protein MUD02_03735, partial [Bacteroidales bacterium]|nr:hypothetical protein [Bacteroidales bacterium]
MNNVRMLLRYFAPYKWSAIRSIAYNVLSAIFALFSFTLVVPFLKILFNQVGGTMHPGDFTLSAAYIEQLGRYYLEKVVVDNGQTGALLLIVFVVILASFFKNGFIFLANNSIAYIRAGTVRDLRRKVYDKVLALPLSFFT